MVFMIDFFILPVFTRTRATIVGATVCFEHIHEKYTTIFELKIEKLVFSFLEFEGDYYFRFCFGTFCWLTTHFRQ